MKTVISAFFCPVNPVWGPPDDRGAQGDPTGESGWVGTSFEILVKISEIVWRLSFETFFIWSTRYGGYGVPGAVGPDLFWPPN